MKYIKKFELFNTDELETIKDDKLRKLILQLNKISTVKDQKTIIDDLNKVKSGINTLIKELK